jgi:quinol monooxygenase YgiN
MSFFVRARFDVLDQRQAEFEEIALALSEQAAQEPGTRTFRWFAAEPGSYLVLEEYADDAAATAHNERAADLLARVPCCAEMVYAEVYGAIGPEIRAWAQSAPHITTFSDFPDRAVEG